MYQILKRIGYFLERFERNYPRIFWFCSVLVALLFNLSQSQIVDEVRFQRTQPSTAIKKKTASVLAISSGGGNQNEPTTFIKPEVPPSNPDNSANSRSSYPNPRYRWGADPSYNPNGGSGSSLPANQTPGEDQWVNDPSAWDKAQENDSSTSEEEENKPGKLGVHVDFQYEYDSNGNPTLLVPNPDRMKRDYSRVEFDQSASHIHHASDFNISLPSDFDMDYYMDLNRAGRINYAKQKLPRETIISYQNELGKAMSPRFGPRETFPVPGFAGKFKRNTELIIQQTNIPDKTILGIIREDGLHISSFPLDDDAVRELIKNTFWVLKDRNI